MVTWRDRLRPVVARAIAAGRKQGFEGKRLRVFLAECCPRRFPYEPWRDEVAWQLRQGPPQTADLSRHWREYLDSPEAKRHAPLPGQMSFLESDK